MVEVELICLLKESNNTHVFPYLYTSPSLPLDMRYVPSGVNDTARTLPFILRSATHIFDFASTSIMYPSLPTKAMRLPSGEVVNFSSDLSLRPLILGILSIYKIERGR
jgi:hypothetical protein